MTFQIREKHIRGLNTAWIEAGDASQPILLLLHGFPDSAEYWDRQIEFFSNSYRIIAPFVRGAKPSEKARDLKRYSPDALAFDVLEILQEVDPLKEKPIYCIGHDLGGALAWHLAHLIQSRLAGLVIINAVTLNQMVKRFKRPKQLLKSWYMFAMQVPKAPELLMQRFPIWFLDFAHAAGDLQGAARPPLSNLRGALSGPMNQYRAFLRATPSEIKRTKKRVAAPVLVIWGSDDAFLLPPSLDEMESEAENVTVRILPGNHWIHRSESVKVNQLIAEFFAVKEVNIEST